MKQMIMVALGFCVMLGAAEAARADLVAHYTFDEGAGTVTAADTGSAPAYDLTAFSGGATRTTDTPNGPGYALDISAGISNVATGTGDNNKVDALGAMTISFWINMRAVTGEFQQIMTDVDSTNSNGWFVQTRNPGSGTLGSNDWRVGFAVRSGGGGTGTIANADIEGYGQDWVFLAITFSDSANQVKYYLGDTTTVVAQLGTTQTLSNSIGNNTTGLRLGKPLTTHSSVRAYLDDVRIYNEVLDATALEAVRAEGMIPEPATMSLLALGGLGALLRRRND